MPLEIFLGTPFSQYLQEIATDRTYGKELTLWTALNIYNVSITLVSFLECEGHLEINLTEFQSFERIVLGHFAEGYKEHSIGLDQEWQKNQNRSSTSLTNVDFNLFKSNDHGSYTSPSMTEHNDDYDVGAENVPSA